MLERQLLVPGLGLLRHDRREPQGALRQFPHLVLAHLINHDELFHGGKHSKKVGVRPRHVTHRAAELVAVHHEQHAGLDLREPVRDTRGTEVGVHHGPHRPYGRGRQQCGYHLGDIGQHAGHPVPRFHAQLPQLRGQRRHTGLQLPPRPPVRFPCLVLAHDGDLVRSGLRGSQRVLRVVQQRTGEPLRPRHVLGGQHSLTGCGSHHPEVLPDSAPELLEVLHRPRVQSRISGQHHTAGLLHPAGESIHPGPHHRFLGGIPEQSMFLVLGGYVHG